ncbi:hypothetical protein [Gracilibacillus xinjiangensis]|uniref:Uncharacterized protein n=1 Tax=Gracilibacillus xinjiangensis TaxID=1193282 RepID=A0ABV8WRD9_9BACI
MANRTVNGDGTTTTGKTVDYSLYDLVTIAAGTNEFKLDVPLGTLSKIGDLLMAFKAPLNAKS